MKKCNNFGSYLFGGMISVFSLIIGFFFVFLFSSKVFASSSLEGMTWEQVQGITKTVSWNASGKFFACQIDEQTGALTKCVKTAERMESKKPYIVTNGRQIAEDMPGTYTPFDEDEVYGISINPVEYIQPTFKK